MSDYLKKNLSMSFIISPFTHFFLVSKYTPTLTRAVRHCIQLQIMHCPRFGLKNAPHQRRQAPASGHLNAKILVPNAYARTHGLRLAFFRPASLKKCVSCDYEKTISNKPYASSTWKILSGYQVILLYTYTQFSFNVCKNSPTTHTYCLYLHTIADNHCSRFGLKNAPHHRWQASASGHLNAKILVPNAYARTYRLKLAFFRPVSLKNCVSFD